MLRCWTSSFQDVPGQVPVISIRKRSALVDTWVVILSTLPVITGEEQQGTDLQNPGWVWLSTHVASTPPLVSTNITPVSIVLEHNWHLRICHDVVTQHTHMTVPWDLFWVFPDRYKLILTFEFLDYAAMLLSDDCSDNENDDVSSISHVYSAQVQLYRAHPFQLCQRSGFTWRLSKEQSTQTKRTGLQGSIVFGLGTNCPVWVHSKATVWL